MVERNTWPPGRTSLPSTADGGGGIGHVFEHLHAGDHVELPGMRVQQLFRRFDAVVDREAGIERMQPRGFHHARREIDGGDLARRARASDLGEQSAAAAHIENAGIGERAALLHVARAHGIELVQRFEFAIDIPEAMCGGFEFRDFRGVAILRIAGDSGCLGSS